MTHNIFRKTTALTFGLVTATAIVAACGTDGTADPAPTSTQQPILTGPEGTLKSPEQQATEAAIAKTSEFYAARGQIEADPTAPVEGLNRVAGNPVLDKYAADITLRRSQGITSTGQIQVLNAAVTDLDAPKDADGNPTANPAWVHVEACTDISGWLNTYPDGRSAMDPDRGQFGVVKLTVRNPNWPDSDGWRVTSEEGKKVDSCNS